MRKAQNLASDLAWADSRKSTLAAELRRQIGMVSAVGWQRPGLKCLAGLRSRWYRAGLDTSGVPSVGLESQRGFEEKDEISDLI
jgi:hypothetical protein